jgi:hypothetical protein
MLLSTHVGRLRGERQGAAAPLATPAMGLRPFEPQFDADVQQMSGAHA